MRRLLFLIVLGVAFYIAESSAQGGYTLYFNRADFDAATHGRTTIDFEGIAPDGSDTTVPLPQGITLSGVNFTTTIVGVPGQSKVDLLVSGKGEIFPGNSVLYTQVSTADPNIVATLPGSFSAFAVDFSARSDGAPLGENVVTFTLSNGDTFTLTTNNADFLSLGFIGLVSTDSFDSVTMSIPPPTSGNADLAIDNFTFGSGGGLEVVPAPSSGVLMLIGLGAILGCAACRSRRAISTA